MSVQEQFTVYVTKYALTDGIRPARVEATSIDGMVRDVEVDWHTVYHKREWSATEAEAVVQAEAMRAKKIASVKKQLAKLEALRFTPSPEDSAEDRT